MSGDARVTQLTQKRALRAAIRSRRAERMRRPGHATRRDHEGAAIAAAVLAQVCAARRAVEVVAVHDALPAEPPTDQLVAALTGRGVRLLYPVLLADNHLAWASTPAGTPHLPEGRTDDPSADDLADADLADADLVIVPALAVDAAGTRLGQGGGSYDRALPRRRPHTPAVALIFDDELLTEAHGAALPREAHDLQVDAVVTPSGGWRRLGSTEAVAR